MEKDTVFVSQRTSLLWSCQFHSNECIASSQSQTKFSAGIFFFFLEGGGNWQAVSKHFNVCQLYLMMLLKIVQKFVIFYPHSVDLVIRYFGSIAENTMLRLEEMSMEIPTLWGELGLSIDSRYPPNVNLFAAHIAPRACHACVSYP